MSKPTRLGVVASVTGSAVTVELAPETISGLVFVEGQGYRVGQVGGFVRIPQGSSSLFAVVTQAGVAAAPTPEIAAEPYGRRWLVVELVGEGQPGARFSRGVAQYPTIGDSVHLVTEDDLRLVYGQESTRDFVEIGHLANARSVPALVEVNRLVTRHSAVVGATGSGKSTTVAGLLTRLSDPERFPSSRILILDIHGEYATAFPDRAHVYRVSPSPGTQELPLYVPFWALTFDELIRVTFGDFGENESCRGHVQDQVTQRKRKGLSLLHEDGISEADVTADTPIPFSIHQLWYDLHYATHATYRARAEQTASTCGEVEPGDPTTVRPPRFQPNDGQNYAAAKVNLPMGRQLEALANRLRDPRLAFLFQPGPWSPNEKGITEKDLGALLAQWLGGAPPGADDTEKDGDARPITILDLSGVPGSILIQLVGALLRFLFDAIFWARNLSQGGRERPLLVVMEEAHGYLKDGMSAAGAAVSRIVKEGRKYGIGAMIVSQRPSEVDQTILSQCGTLVAMRLGNSTDRAHVASVLSENLRGLLDMLPTLRTGEAIVVGEAVNLPTRTLIHPPPRGRRPSSEDPRVVEVEFAPNETGPGGWDRAREPGGYEDVVTVWRRQDPRSPRARRDEEETR